MRTVDLVRYGSLAIRNPVVGLLYSQLVQDWLVGETRPDRVYAAITGSSTRQVTRALDVLQHWGVLTRLGGTRARRLVLQPMVNVQWCRDVITGLHGKEGLENVVTGSTAAELCPSEGPSDPVVNYAVQQVLGLYGKANLFPFAFPESSDRTGTGSVIHADFRQNDGVDLRQSYYTAFVVSMYQPHIQVLCSGSLAEMNAQVARYPVELPATLVPNPKITSTYQRAARAKKYDTPTNSFALLYWPMDKIKEHDAANYDTIEALVSDWNKAFGHEEKLDRKIYARIRFLLVENTISADDVRRSFKAAAIDKFWGQNAILSSYVNDVGRIRKMSKQNTHDRYARGFKAIPNQAEVVATEF